MASAAQISGCSGTEAEIFWTEFLRFLPCHSLHGVKLVIFGAHEGLEAATNRILGATAQQCKIHFQRNAIQETAHS